MSEVVVLCPSRHDEKVVRQCPIAKNDTMVRHVDIGDLGQQHLRILLPFQDGA